MITLRIQLVLVQFNNLFGTYLDAETAALAAFFVDREFNHAFTSFHE